jgi:hypothetical protein
MTELKWALLQPLLGLLVGILWPFALLELLLSLGRSARIFDFVFNAVMFLLAVETIRELKAGGHTTRSVE